MKSNKANKYISNKEYKFLMENLDEPRTPIFYGLPKIHKSFDKIPPFRPIVSGYKSCTANLSEYLDSFLKYQAQHCKSFIRDTKHFLIKINSLKNIPKNCILVTMDVSSLYTNIDQDEGAEACFQKLESRKNKTVPSSFLKKLILVVLQSNVFRFGTSFYSQIKGTAMGTPMAPNYANIFMDIFEQNLVEAYYNKTGIRPLIWLRYIDDIFFIWTHGDESLNQFIEFAQTYSDNQNMKSNMKFEVNQSTEKVNFLDITIILKDGVLTTTVYSKPTDSHLYLNVNSCHPEHVIKNIPKGQLLRLRRICSNTTDFIHQCNTYINYFINGGYNKSRLESLAKEIIKIDRNQLLQNTEKSNPDSQTIFTCTYHPQLTKLPHILRNHYHILQNYSLLSKIFTEKPMVAFRKKKTIGNHIVRSDITPHQITLSNPSLPCGKCKKTCHLINQSTKLTNSKNKRSVDITSGGSCKT